MYGYKALSQDMKAVKGNDMQYEIGKNYLYDRPIHVYHEGYHFYNDIISALVIYNGVLLPRIFFIEAKDQIERSATGIYCTNNITIVKEVEHEDVISYIEHNDLVNSDKTNYRKAAACFGYKLDKLMYDDDYDIRIIVAKHGYRLDEMIKDPMWAVRQAIAKTGKYLDVLLYDDDEDVRKEVANQGFGLDELVKDDSWVVRNAVAHQGYGLDILINDPIEIVRESVISHKNYKESR